MVFNISVFAKMKNIFCSILTYAKEYPFISFAYLFIFIFGVYLRIFVAQNFGTLQWDEGAHSIGGILISRTFLNMLQRRHDLIGFIGQYVTDYPATIGGLWFYPFGYSFFTSAAYLLSGFNEFSARLPSLVLSILLIHPTVRIAKEIDSRENVAIVSAFLVATSSSIIIVGSAAMIDIPQTTLTMYSILYWIKGIKNRTRNDLLKAGLLGGLAGLMKPSGVIILFFMVVFQALMFLTSRDSLIFSKKFLKGMASGFLVFSTWWMSALILKIFVGGGIGEAALSGVLYWFSVFGGYTPPWYSPPWYQYEGWIYYANQLSFYMGVLPFVFFFVGVGSRLKEMKRSDLPLIFFILTIYILQSFISNKNPRYLIVCLPLLYIYSSVGMNTTYSTLMKHLFPPRKTTALRIARISTAILLILILGVGSLIPIYNAIKARYIPGMGFGVSLPIREALETVTEDKDTGIIIPDSEDNSFNAQTLTFYIASIDYHGKYGCYSPPSHPEDIFSINIEEKEVRYILVHDLDSVVSQFIQLNPSYFILLGEVENNYGTISVYKVTS